MKNYYFWTIIVWVFIVELYSVLPYRIPTSEINNRSQLSSKYFSDPEIAQGIIHVHSTFSDGGGAPDVIAKEAAKAGMDFVILTDHNNYEARKSGFEKQYGRTDLFVEMESATPAGHVISFFSES
ncbi:MAG: PHP domain-containing protein, partial [Proteobacteria bacterium]|nr:PHP domain-containing protein [Pseudomonadota bacterium]